MKVLYMVTCNSKYTRTLTFETLFRVRVQQQHFLHVPAAQPHHHATPAKVATVAQPPGGRGMKEIHWKGPPELVNLLQQKAGAPDARIFAPAPARAGTAGAADKIGGVEATPVVLPHAGSAPGGLVSGIGAPGAPVIYKPESAAERREDGGKGASAGKGGWQGMVEVVGSGEKALTARGRLGGSHGQDELGAALTPVNAEAVMAWPTTTWTTPVSGAATPVTVAAAAAGKKFGGVRVVESAVACAAHDSHSLPLAAGAFGVKVVTASRGGSATDFFLPSYSRQRAVGKRPGETSQENQELRGFKEQNKRPKGSGTGEGDKEDRESKCKRRLLDDLSAVKTVPGAPIEVQGARDELQMDEGVEESKREGVRATTEKEGGRERWGRVNGGSGEGMGKREGEGEGAGEGEAGGEDEEDKQGRGGRGSAVATLVSGGSVGLGKAKLEFVKTEEEHQVHTGDGAHGAAGGGRGSGAAVGGGASAFAVGRRGGPLPVAATGGFTEGFTTEFTTVAGGGGPLNGVSVKVRVGEKTHRFQVDCLRQLQEVVRQKLGAREAGGMGGGRGGGAGALMEAGALGGSFDLTYVDCDDDIITVGSEAEFQEAAHHAVHIMPGNVLKLTVVPL
jgi:hypothetical protein